MENNEANPSPHPLIKSNLIIIHQITLHKPLLSPVWHFFQSDVDWWCDEVSGNARVRVCVYLHLCFAISTAAAKPSQACPQTWKRNPHSLPPFHFGSNRTVLVSQISRAFIFPWQITHLPTVAINSALAAPRSVIMEKVFTWASQILELAHCVHTWDEWFRLLSVMCLLYLSASEHSLGEKHLLRLCRL